MAEHEQKPGQGLSKLELLILRNIPKAKGIGDIAKVAGVPPAALGKEVAILQMKGYIAADGRLTEKGLEAAKG
jgi:DNA-binding MarR family transcriptional regulator